MDESKQQLAGLVADLDSLAGLWQKSASTEDDRYGAHLAGYDEGLRLCARQLRKALKDALAQAAS